MMLPREGKLADLLGLLYQGTTDDNAWNPFLREVATAVGGESAAFMLGNPDTDLHLISHHWGQDPEGIRLYIEYYNKLDVWAAKARHIPTPHWLGPSKALCPFDQLTRTEYFSAWSKDLGRLIDYLGTRPDIDHNKLAYEGLSMGAAMGALLPAVDDRLKALILISPGFYLSKRLPEVDQLNFAPRVKVPVLMLNGRFDFIFPVGSSQEPMFRLLGTPKETSDA